MTLYSCKNKRRLWFPDVAKVLGETWLKKTLLVNLINYEWKLGARNFPQFRLGETLSNPDDATLGSTFRGPGLTAWDNFLQWAISQSLTSFPPRVTPWVTKMTTVRMIAVSFRVLSRKVLTFVVLEFVTLRGRKYIWATLIKQDSGPFRAFFENFRRATRYFYMGVPPGIEVIHETLKSYLPFKWKLSSGTSTGICSLQGYLQEYKILAGILTRLNYFWSLTY